MKIATSTKTKGTDFERAKIEEGIHEAELKEVKDISEGQYGERVAFIYTIDKQNVDLAFVCYKTKATENNKIGQTLLAHGVKIEDQEVDTDNLPQKRVRVWVEDFTKEIENDGKKEQVTSSIISKVKPLVETEKISA